MLRCPTRRNKKCQMYDLHRQVNDMREELLRLLREILHRIGCVNVIDVFRGNEHRNDYNMAMVELLS